MNVTYRKRIPYQFTRVLAQYFDLEHIETVHPTTLGDYRVLEVSGKRILFQQRWPAWLGVRVSTVIEQVWAPPDQIHIRFLKGFLRGVEISSRLQHDNQDTLIEEIYYVPLVPDWSWLRFLVRPFVVRGVDHIWQEDLAVELCHGGWPGVPGEVPQASSTLRSYQPASVSKEERWVRVAEQVEILDGHSHTVQLEGREIVLWQHQGQFYALGNRCPHTGGPLSLGRLQGDCIVCPWHGTQFQLDNGLPCNGPAEEGVDVYPVRLSGQGLLIQIAAID